MFDCIHIYANSKYIYIYTYSVCYVHRFFIVCVYIIIFSPLLTSMFYFHASWEWRAWDPAPQAGPYRLYVLFQWGWSGCFKWLGLPPLINHLQSWVILQVLGREWGNEALHGLRWGFIPSNPNRPGKYIYLYWNHEGIFTFFSWVGSVRADFPAQTQGSWLTKTENGFLEPKY